MESQLLRERSMSSLHERDNGCCNHDVRCRCNAVFLVELELYNHATFFGVNCRKARLHNGQASWHKCMTQTVPSGTTYLRLCRKERTSLTRC